MIKRGVASNAGLCVYGASAILLGVVGLVSGDFATNWQRVTPHVPHRAALAFIAAVCELLAGTAVLWRRTAQAGALVLTILYAVFALLWVPRIFAAPRVYDSWANFFEESSLMIAGAVACTSLARSGSWARRLSRVISRLYGICVVSFGLEHLFYISATASFVPRWIPPGQLFWAYATAIFFLLAAAAILSGILASLASRLLTVMILGFEVLIWLPRLFASPHRHFVWAANGICMALAGAAWVIADSFAQSRSSTISMAE
jgi:uncharacterized membrane protein